MIGPSSGFSQHRLPTQLFSHSLSQRRPLTRRSNLTRPSTKSRWYSHSYPLSPGAFHPPILLALILSSSNLHIRLYEHICSLTSGMAIVNVWMNKALYGTLVLNTFLGSRTDFREDWGLEPTRRNAVADVCWYVCIHILEL